MIRRRRRCACRPPRPTSARASTAWRPRVGAASGARGGARPGEFAVETDLPVARGRENLCVRAFERLHPADGFTLPRSAREIPLSGGLGSSAAAIVAGLMAADHLFELDADLLALATELEGHPDNVAAALRGGFVICADGEADALRAAHGPGGARGRARARPVRTRAARAALPARGPARRRPSSTSPTPRCSRSAWPAATGTWSRAACTTACTSPSRAHAVPALLRAGPARPRAGRARRDDLRRGPDRARVVLLRADRRRRRGAARGDRGLGELAARAVRGAGGLRRRALSRGSLSARGVPPRTPGSRASTSPASAR